MSQPQQPCWETVLPLRLPNLNIFHGGNRVRIASASPEVLLDALTVYANKHGFFPSGYLFFFREKRLPTLDEIRRNVVRDRRRVAVVAAPVAVPVAHQQPLPPPILQGEVGIVDAAPAEPEIRELARLPPPIRSVHRVQKKPTPFRHREPIAFTVYAAGLRAMRSAGSAGFPRTKMTLEAPRTCRPCITEPRSGQFVPRGVVGGLPRKEIFETHIKSSIQRLNCGNRRERKVARRLKRVLKMKAERDSVGVEGQGVKRKAGEGEEEIVNFFETPAGQAYLNSA